MSSELDGRPFDLIERVSLWTSAFCMVGMVLLILAEVVLRGVFNSTTGVATSWWATCWLACRS